MERRDLRRRVGPSGVKRERRVEDADYWIYWQLPNGRSGKLGPFCRFVGPPAMSNMCDEPDVEGLTAVRLHWRT